MKTKIIQILKDESLSQVERYNQLLMPLAEKKGPLAVRAFQVGYNQFKYDSLIHEIRKAYEIRDIEIHEFKQNDETETTQESGNAGTDPQIGGGQNPLPEQDPKTEQSGESFPEIDEEAKGGLKIRDEYPFLNDANCPDEFKILVADKISAWKNFAQNHADLALITGVDLDSEDVPELAKEEAKARFESLSEEEKEEEMYNLAKHTIADFQLNADIKEELDAYKETGRVLGKHPKLNDLRIRQEIYDIETEAELGLLKKKAQQNASKAEKEIETKGESDSRKQRVHDWRLREKLITERLEKEFAKKK